MFRYLRLVFNLGTKFDLGAAITEAFSRRCSVKKLFLKISQNFAGKHLCQSLSLNKVTCNFTKKESLAQVFFCQFCEVFKNRFFYRSLQVVASVISTRSIWKIRFFPDYLEKIFGSDLTSCMQKQPFFKIDILRNLAKFTGKPLCQSLLFNKVAG